MATFALKLCIFVSSTTEMAAERERVLRVLERRRRECESDGLLLTRYSWDRSMEPGFGRPQTQVIERLRRSDLVIVMFGSSIGTPASAAGSQTGMEEELRIASEMVRAGESDNLFVYIRQPITCPRVREIYETAQAEKSMVVMGYKDIDDLGEQIEWHTNAWLRRWSPVPAICEWALQRTPSRMPRGAQSTLLGQNRLIDVERKIGPVSYDDKNLAVLGEHAVKTYQRAPGQGIRAPIPEELCARLEARYVTTSTVPPALAQYIKIFGLDAASTPVVRTEDGNFHFSDETWYHFCRAFGLVRAVCARDVEAVAYQPYQNEVHQYLSALYSRALAPAQQDAFSGALRRWVSLHTPETGQRPIARNFAAYVLGMIGCADAVKELLDAAERDPGEDVRLYSVCALGKMRVRRSVPLLIHIFQHDDNERVRSTASQAICRIIGVANYEL